MPAGEFSDYKALIVTFKLGGEDSCNTVIPIDPVRHAVYAAARPTIGIAAEALASTALDENLALHPSLAPLLPAWEAGDMAIGHNIGTLHERFGETDAEHIAAIRQTNAFYVGPPFLPVGLRGHGHQQWISSSLIARGFFNESGFGGRIIDRFAGHTGASALTMGSRLAGSPEAALLLAGRQRMPVIGLPPLGRRFSRTAFASGNQTAALVALSVALGLEYATPRHRRWQAEHATMVQGEAFYDPIVSGSAAPFAVDAAFTSGSGAWRNALKLSARAIERRDMAGGAPRRQIFFIGYGDYDTHSAEGGTSGRLASLHADWSAGVAEFRAAMIALGDWDKVLLLDLSDFSRTLNENGAAGSDHAWAGERFVFGGAVRGKGRDGSSGAFGSYPAELSNTTTSTIGTGTRDQDSGVLIPEHSLEEWLAAPLAWFGCDAADLDYVMPRRSVLDRALPSVAAA